MQFVIVIMLGWMSPISGFAMKSLKLNIWQCQIQNKTTVSMESATQIDK